MFYTERTEEAKVEHYESWYQKMRRERQQRGWTQEEVARQVGCDSKTVGRWERGEAVPGLYYRQKLVKIYGKKAEELGLIDDITVPNSSTPVNVGQKVQEINKHTATRRASWQEDWGEAPSTYNFCGREQELATVEQWIIGDRCRMIVVLGLGGVGKTTFATQVARIVQGVEQRNVQKQNVLGNVQENVQKQFEYVFWHSLQHAPSIEHMLESCLQLVSDQRQANIPQSVDERISLLLSCLRTHRCLLLLDNVESVLQAGTRAGLYREGYEAYGRLFQRIGESDHQSCLLLTSREKPKEVAHMEGMGTSPVRSLPLAGIGPAHGQQLLQDKSLFGSDEVWSALVHLYTGNPLALKVVSEPIREVFGGDIAAFLKEHTIVVGDIYDLLNQQFHRLSELELEVMYWLALEREVISLAEIQADMGHPTTRALLDAFDSLLRRFMIESRGDSCFTLQPVIMEYVTERFVNQVYHELETETIALLGSHALIKAQTNDYVRESQVRFVLAPLVEKMRSSYGDIGSEIVLKKMLTSLRALQPRKFSYAAGNVLNLLVHLHVDLHDYDFSNMVVQQAYLQGIDLAATNFAYADLSTSVFTETFTSVLCLALSPNGVLLAVGTTTGEVLLRQADNLIPLYACSGHADGIRSLAFSPDGEILASGSEDQTIRFWDTATGSCLNILHGHSGYVRSVAFSPNGKLLASGSEDQTIRFWDTTTGSCLNILRGHTHWIRSLAFSPDGRILASGSDDRTVRFWDSSTGSCLNVLNGHTSYVRSIAFAPAGGMLASGSEDQTIRIWDTSTGHCLVVLQGHTDRIRAVSFSPDGELLASGSDDQTIRLWNTDLGQCVKTWQAHTNRIWSIAFSPAGKQLVSVSEDETIRLWDVYSGRCLRKLHGYTSLIKAVAFRADGQMLVSGNEDQLVRLWDVKTGQCLKALQGHANRVRAVAFSPDKTTIASGSEDETVRLWDSDTGQCLKILQGHTHLIRSVAFNSDGSMLASGSHDETIRFWDVHTGQCLKVLPGQGELVWCVAFNVDSTLLASGSEDQQVRVWDVHSGQCLRVLKGHTHRVWSVAFAPNGYMLVSAGDDQTIRIWDALSGQHIKTLQGHTQWCRSVAISPDGNFLASGSHDQTVRIWDMNSDNCLKILRGHSSCVWSVAFSLDKRIVASGSDDGTTKIWDIQTGTCLKTLRSDRPYEHMNITGVRGLTEAQKVALRALGAID